MVGAASTVASSTFANTHATHATGAQSTSPAPWVIPEQYCDMPLPAATCPRRWEWWKAVVFRDSVTSRRYGENDYVHSIIEGITRDNDKLTFCIRLTSSGVEHDWLLFELTKVSPDFDPGAHVRMTRDNEIKIDGNIVCDLNKYIEYAQDKAKEENQKKTTTSIFTRVVPVGLGASYLLTTTATMVGVVSVAGIVGLGCCIYYCCKGDSP